jgi:predicted RNA binding protein YcfA (HicA-like mRNA interferase family)
MRLPRDIPADDLIKGLKAYEYSETRQTGSHVRLTTLRNGEHHITIPKHDPLRIGTLSSILSDVAGHFNVTKDEIAGKLFG